MFIGREREMEFLRERYASSDAQLIALYGRRRVGKTETLRQFCQERPHMFYSCTQVNDAAQLKRFSQAMFAEDLPIRRHLSSLQDWEQAFTQIAELPYGDKKRLVIIDEFPYMCDAEPSIPSILQTVWDTELKRRNVMIILCGSAMSYMEKKILSEKNPLYGRATGIYKMRELGFYDAAKFFPDYSAEDKVLAYSILGGIPHYLCQWDPKISVGENVCHTILRPGSILYSETDFLLRQELREPGVYNAVLQAIAGGCTKLNEISQRSYVHSTAKTTMYLKPLMELGLVRREGSMDISGIGLTAEKHARYVLNDALFRFWYAYGFPNYSELEYGAGDELYEHLIARRLHQFASQSFEDVCRQYVRLLQKLHAFPVPAGKTGRWYGKTMMRGRDGKKRHGETEVDIVTRDWDGSAFFLGECKFSSRPCDMSIYRALQAKLGGLPGKIFYGLFSAGGFEEELVACAHTDPQLFLYGIEDIVAGTKPICC